MYLQGDDDEEEEEGWGLAPAAGGAGGAAGSGLGERRQRFSQMARLHWAGWLAAGLASMHS